MKTFNTILVLFLMFAANGCKQFGNKAVIPASQTDSIQIPHLERQGTAMRLIAGGEPFLMLSGELHNSTCGGFEFMRPVWKKLSQKNLNTVIATVSWELVEPEQGKFNFALVDGMIAGARDADIKLVLIWFGSWKNAGS